MHRLKNMKETLVSCVQAEMADIKHANTHELGEAIDMIKDLEEAMYYCSIVKAMEEQEKTEGHARHYYTPYPYYERDMDRGDGRMYYTGQPRNSKGEFMSRGGGRVHYEDDMSRYYDEKEVPFDLRDPREGRSPASRRHYMESKELHHGKEKKIKELEKYMKELSEDIVEMIEDASPEEKQMLEKKMTHLTSKIAQINSNA